MNKMNRDEIQKRLYDHAKKVLVSEYYWETAQVTKRKNKDIVFGQNRDSLDRGKYMGRNSLMWGLRVYLKAGYMDLQIDAEHGWILDPKNRMHRRKFMEYFWALITADEALMVQLAMSEIDQMGKIVALKFI